MTSHVGSTVPIRLVVGMVVVSIQLAVLNPGPIIAHHHAQRGGPMQAVEIHVPDAPDGGGCGSCWLPWHAEHVFLQLDWNQDGILDWDEMPEDLQLFLQDEPELWQTIDTDADDFVSYEEFILLHWAEPAAEA